MSERVVLDASALLALVAAEPGANVVATLLDASTISSVNLSEVVAKLADYGVPEAAIRSSLTELALDVTDFTASTAVSAGLLRPSTKALGLSLGDRACLALGMEMGATVVTAERIWSGLTLDIPVHVIR